VSGARPRAVFITGARGFIGAALATRYRALGAEVRGVDTAPGGDADVVTGDISEVGPWQAHAGGSDLVIHTAAVVSNTAPPDLFWRVNVLGTRRVVEAAARGGARRLVHFSSVRAYGDSGFPDKVDESWPVHPDGHPYVDTKVASEQVVLQAHAEGALDVTVVRPGDVYGPGSRPWTLLPVEGIRTGKFLLPDAGRGIFSPVYVDNLVDGVVLAASDAGIGQVFNLSDGVGVSNADFFGHYYRMLDRRPVTAPAALARLLFGAAGAVDRIRRVPSEATSDVVEYFLRRGTYSIEKARRLLGYEPAIDLAEGMRRTEAWLRERGLV